MGRAYRPGSGLVGDQGHRLAGRRPGHTLGGACRRRPSMEPPRLRSPHRLGTNTGSASADLIRHPVRVPNPPLVSSRMRTAVSVGPAHPHMSRDLDLARMRQRRCGQSLVGPQPDRILVLPERVRVRAGDGPQQLPVPSPRPEGVDLLLGLRRPIRASGRNGRRRAPVPRRPRAMRPGSPCAQRRHRLTEGIEVLPPGIAPGHRRSPEITLEGRMVVVAGPVALDPVRRWRATIQPGGTDQSQVVVAHDGGTARRSPQQVQHEVDRAPDVGSPIHEVAEEDEGASGPLGQLLQLPDQPLQFEPLAVQVADGDDRVAQVGGSSITGMSLPRCPCRLVGSRADCPGWALHRV